jgi:DNA/RNA endonuclease YhcR with UshA esterase domain
MDKLSVADVGDMAFVEGTVTDVDPFSAGVKFTLDDGSGTVTLLLWQDLWEVVPERSALAQGATLRVLGQVAEYGGDLEIIPELPSDVMVVAAGRPSAEALADEVSVDGAQSEAPVGEQPVSERQLGEISSTDVGQVVTVEGILKSLRTFSAGMKGILDDGTGTVTLLLWQDVYDGIIGLDVSPADGLVPGAVLRVEGEVSQYKGELQVVPLVSADVSMVGRVTLALEERAIGQITAQDLDQTVRVAGRIIDETAFSKGVKYTLDDGTGVITLLLWQDVYDGLDDPGLLGTGAQLSVRGVVAEYHGSREIVPQIPVDVTVLSPKQVALNTSTSTHEPTMPPTATVKPTQQPTDLPVARPTSSPTTPPTATPETRSVGQITGEDVGTTFTVARAGIAEVDYFSKGVKYLLTDSTGSITLLVWQNVMESLADRHHLFPGSQVWVMGEINEYQGELEIVPRSGVSVAVLTRGERPAIEERLVGAITPADEGRIFVVEGIVARTESRGWQKLWLNDGTGEILLFVPQRMVEYLPSGVGPGVKLQVTGEVDIYQGVLEIIPQAGADVKVR